MERHSYDSDEVIAEQRQQQQHQDLLRQKQAQDLAEAQRVAQEKAALKNWYEKQPKSHYYSEFDLFNPAVTMVESVDDMISTAVSVQYEIPHVEVSDLYPPLKGTFEEWDDLVRIMNLRDVLEHENSSVLFKIVALKPDLNDPLVSGRYKAQPRYYGLNTCRNKFWSEYPFIREEGYRCLHDMNRAKSAKNWPNDTPKYHLPALIVTRNAEISQRGYLSKSDSIVIPSESCWGWHIGEYEVPATRVEVPAGKTVFIATQYWMDNVFHVLIETMGRIAPYYEHLLRDPNVLIHIPETREGSMSMKAFQFLGFPREKLISGNAIAPYVVMPEPQLHCTVASPFQVRALKQVVLSRLAQDHMYPQIKDPSHRYEDYILVVKRTGEHRKVTNHDEMVAAIQALYPNEKIAIFSDNPPLPLHEAFWMFRNAKLIVAPHGAGLSNMLACRESVKIVEMLVNDNFINVNFAMLAQELGYEYHGFSPDNDSHYQGDITADIDLLVKILKKVMPPVTLSAPQQQEPVVGGRSS
ncbi:hypothetical protein HK102_013408 [Quaeritorhiza haematococci]|nr:hypothetical protein HK102_013408 [Quaeritorhiza haematococci]